MNARTLIVGVIVWIFFALLTLAALAEIALRFAFCSKQKPTTTHEE